MYREVPKDMFSNYPNIDLTQNLSAVTAACMMFKRETFDEVWGFDEGLAVNFNDVDFCLKVREKGLLVVYNPFVNAYHYESKSRGIDTETKEKRENFGREYNLFVRRWLKEIQRGDPYFNKNYRLDLDVPTINYQKIVY